MSGLEVIVCGPELAREWDSFLAGRSDSSFYHLFGWKAVNEESFGHSTFFLAAMRDGRMTGVFPLVYIRSRVFGRILCSMPFVNYGGPSAADGESEAALIERAVSIAGGLKADYMEIRCIRRLPGDLPAGEHKVSLTIELSPGADALWNGLSTKQRTNVRRAYKNGLEARAGGIDLLDGFYALFTESWRDLGTPVYNIDYFRRILREFPDKTRIFLACMKDGTPVAGAFNGHFNGTVEGMWAASPARYRQLQANYVLYWEMIKDACEKGFTKYHLGRSTADSGGEAFKSKWNASPTQLYWHYHMRNGGPMPGLNTGNPKYRMAINAWKRLPVRFANLIGPLFAGQIP